MTNQSPNQKQHPRSEQELKDVAGGAPLPHHQPPAQDLPIMSDPSYFGGKRSQTTSEELGIVVGGKQLPTQRPDMESLPIVPDPSFSDHENPATTPDKPGR